MGSAVAGRPGLERVSGWRAQYTLPPRQGPSPGLDPEAGKFTIIRGEYTASHGSLPAGHPSRNHPATDLRRTLLRLPQLASHRELHFFSSHLRASFSISSAFLMTEMESVSLLVLSTFVLEIRSQLQQLLAVIGDLLSYVCIGRFETSLRWLACRASGSVRWGRARR